LRQKRNPAGIGERQLPQVETLGSISGFIDISKGSLIDNNYRALAAKRIADFYTPNGALQLHGMAKAPVRRRPYT
jgi:hypothetical protein